MISDNNTAIDISEFLKEHRQKIIEDKRILNDVLNILQEKSQDSHECTQDDSLNKLDQKFDAKNPFSEQDLYKDDKPRVMVRYGEFSPLNPAFRSSSKPLLGLGEYEERRKIFLEKKKREYLQYLSKAKNEKEREKSRLKASETKENDIASRISSAKLSDNKQKMPREIFSPGRGIIEDSDRCFARWQQEAYRKELDRQISEKRKRQKEEKRKEKEECEKKQKERREDMKRCSSIVEKMRQNEILEKEFRKEISNSYEKENQPLLENHIAENSHQYDSSYKNDIDSKSERETRKSPTRDKSSDKIFHNSLERQPGTHTSPMFVEASTHERDPEAPLPSQIISPIFLTASKHERDPDIPLPAHITSPLFQTASKHERNPDEPLPARIASPLFLTASNHQRDIDVPKPSRLNSPLFSVAKHKLESISGWNGLPGGRTESPITAGKKTVTKDIISPVEIFQKMQQELYKQELAKQIEEKRQMEMERKQKEEEEDRRIEQKVREEEEKLRKEYEMEQTERLLRAAQKIQQESKFQEQLRKIQKEAEERKKNFPKNPVLFKTVVPTSHGVIKSSMKNVSFAQDSYVNSAQDMNEYLQSDEVTSTENRKSDSEVIIEAPYTMAVKGTKLSDEHSISQNGVTDKSWKRPPSPPVPAIRTKNLLKSLPKTDDIIPSTVSMSKETREKFLKDSKILSNLSEIRRTLLEKQIDRCTA